MPKSDNKFFNHITSLEASANALYSASAELREVRDCFLDLQEIATLPSRKQYPPTDLRSLGSAP